MVKGWELLWSGTSLGQVQLTWHLPGSPGLLRAARARRDKAAGWDLVWGSCSLWAEVPAGLCPS